MISYRKLLFALVLSTMFFLGLTSLAAAAPAGSSSDVDAAGAYHTGVSIAVPPFRGIEPNVSISYSSHAGNGLVGVGWHLNASSYIVRASPGRGAPKYDDTDIFLLDGMELVPCAAGSQSPSCLTGGTHSTKVENFARIKREYVSKRVQCHPPKPGGCSIKETHWTIWTKNGTRLTYAPQPFADNNPHPVYGSEDLLTYRWALSIVEDTHGNKVNYWYWCDGEQECYLSKITYADAPSTTRFDGAEVDFYYEKRADQVSYATGGGVDVNDPWRHNELVVMDYRLKTIGISMAGEHVDAYTLRYTSSATTSRSLLEEVQQYGNDVIIDSTGAVTGTSLPPLSFQMTSSPGTWNSDLPYDQDLEFPPVGTTSILNYRIGHCESRATPGQYDACIVGSYSGDVTGDGKDDWIGIRMYTTGSGYYYTLHEEFVTLFRDPSGHLQSKTQAIPDMLIGTTFGGLTRLWLMDLDGDGREDILTEEVNFNHSPICGIDKPWCIIPYISNGDGSYSRYDYIDGREDGYYECMPSDVNGDEQEDLLCYEGLFSFLSNQVTALAMNGSGKMLFAGTEGYGGFNSSDGGESWQVGGTLGEADVLGIDRSVNALSWDGVSDTLYAGAWGGVFKSDNGGGTWQAANKGISSETATALAWDSENNTLYAGTDGNGVFKSSDGGETWQAASNGINSKSVVALLLDGVSNTLYAGTHNTGVFKSNDGGGSWQAANNGIDNMSVKALAWDGVSNTLYAGTVTSGVFKSSDGGGSWQAANNGISSIRINALAWDGAGNTLYAGTVGSGVLKSSDGGETWQAANKGISSTSVNALLWCGASGTLYAGADGGGLFETNDGGWNWQDISNGIPDKGVHTRTYISNGNGTFTIMNGIWGFHSPYDYTNDETSEILVGDVNNDGLTDILSILDQEIEVGISNGDGTYRREHQSIPWPVPDRAANSRFINWMVADIDSDGRSDVVMLLTDQILTARAQAQHDGRFTLQQQNLIQALPPETQASMGDTNGDGRTDLLIIRPHDAHPAQPNCMPAVNQKHIALSRILSNGDGTFYLPHDWDCSSRHTDWPWSDVSGLTQTRSTDVNGDGLADFLVTYTDNSCTSEPCSTHIIDDPSASTAADRFNWTPVDINGDGRQDLVYTYFLNPGVRVYSLIKNPNGTYDRKTQDITPTANLPGLDDPDARRWLAVDTGGPPKASPTGQVTYPPDGRTDLIYVDYASNGIRVYTLFSNGDGTWKTIVDNPWPGFEQTDTHHWKPMDVNGDGRMDLVYVLSDSGMNRIRTLLSSGDGKWTRLSDDHGVNSGSPCNGPDNLTVNWRPVDANGDGKSDMVDSSPGCMTTWLSNGDGKWTEVMRPVSGSPRTRGLRSGDLNGDGLTDLVDVGHAPSGNANDLVFTTYISIGNGQWLVETVSPAEFQGFPESDTLNWKPNDVNRDGRTDLVHISGYPDGASYKTEITVALNLPDGWRKIVTSNLVGMFIDTWKWRVMDTDGDGKPGFVYVSPWGSYFAPQGIIVWSLQANWPSERMEQLDNGMGGKTTIRYGTSIGKHAYMPGGAVIETASSITTEGGGNSSTLTYGYEGARWSDAGRRFLGFAKITAEDTARSVIHYDLSDECGAQVRETALQSLNGGTFRSASYYYGISGMNSKAPWTCQLTTEVDYEYELTSSGRPVSKSYEYDAYGNLTKLFEDGLSSDQNDDRLTSSEYYPNTTAYIVGLPAYQNVYGYVYDGQAWRLKTMSSTLFEYDYNTTYAAPPGSLGELRRIKDWNDQDETYPTTEIEYDQRGNETRIAVPLSRYFSIWTSITYDSMYQLYPETVCNAKYCTSQTWDKALGLVLSTTDPNSQSTIYQYDVFRRPTRTNYTDGSRTGIDYLDWGNPSSQRVRTWITDRSQGDGVLWRESYFDGLGRTYQTVREGNIEQDFIYADASARLLQESNSYEMGEKPVWTTYEYDVIDRLSKVTHPDGSSARIEYGVGSLTAYDELNHERVTSLDAYGRPTQVRETNTVCKWKVVLEERHKRRIWVCDPEYYYTQYQYDPLDRLVKLIDQSGNETSASWDSLGRKLESCNPDMGCWRYGYYDNGLLRWQIDAKRQRTQYIYDEIGRVQKKYYLDAAGNDFRTVTWHYDSDPTTGTTQGFSIGQVTLVEDLGASTSDRLWYDAMGRVESNLKCIGSQCAKLNYKFDEAGRLKTVTYPDDGGNISSKSEILTYNYDQQGRLSDIPGYVVQFGYNSADQLTFSWYSNGTKTEYEYDPQRYWLDSANVHEAVSNDVIYRATYTHSAEGQITNMEFRNDRQGNTIGTAFTYDDLGRLTGLKSSDQSLNRSFKYDALGNMTFNSSVGLYTYGHPQHVHAVTGIPNRTYQYDANGNLERSTERRIRWDYDNMPVAISNAYGTTSFEYDPAGQRVRKIGPDGSKTYYFGPLVERAPDGSLVKYYYAGSLLVAKRDSTGLHYYHQDHLGSTRLLTDEHSNVTERYDYEPFGGVRSASAATTIGFGGHDTDSETGLIYMNARYYDPVLARFISADGIVPEPFDPQSLNRYSYVRNNPISRIDPSGHTDSELCRTYPNDGACTGYYGDSSASQVGIGFLLGWGLGELTKKIVGPPDQLETPTNPHDASYQFVSYGLPASGVAAAPTFTGPQMSAVSQGEILGMAGESLLNLDMPPGPIMNSLWPAYGLTYGLKHTIYNPIKNWILDLAHSGPTYVDAGIGVPVMRAATHDHTDALGALVQIGMFFLPVRGGPVVTGETSVVAEEAAIALEPELSNAPTAALRSPVEGIHSQLDKIAMRQRATVVIRAVTPEGTLVDVFASGVRDLSPIQRTAVEALGNVCAKSPGLHAEPTALRLIYNRGWTPLYGRTAGQPVCPWCWLEMGAEYISPYEFIFR